MQPAFAHLRDAGADVPTGDAAFTWRPTSLYIHIPFCSSRCHYCDFTTYVAPQGAREAYVTALERELSLLADAAGPLKTIFVGGGTPTMLNAAQLSRVFAAVRTYLPVVSDAEITVEANPGTVDEAKLEALLENGVNRISFGAQTFDDRLLLAIGRSHDSETAAASVQMARTAGFQRINMDLMFGLPEQSLDDVHKAIDAVLELGVEHVSAYWLKVEPGTPFAKWQEAGLLPLPGEDIEADMYDLVRNRLQQSGYRHYEVSNFAKPGAEARHNLVYWRNEPYLAVGVGAHGYAHGVRYENVHSLAEYHRLLSAGQAPVAYRHVVDGKEAMENTMMLGLRLREGVSEDRFRRRHGCGMHERFGGVMDRLMERGLLTWDDGAVRLTERAWPVANLVFEEFVLTPSVN